jgi:molybdopterin synthase sulfur carrier subunit
MPTVFIPPQLRSLTGGASQVAATGTSVRRVVDDLEASYPGLKDRLCEGDVLRSGLAVAVDGTISSLGLMQKVGDTSEVHFLPAIGGG